MVLKDVKFNEAIQCQVNDRLRARSETFDPVLGVVLFRFRRNFPQNGIENKVSHFRIIQKNEGVSICVNAGYQRKFRKYGADDGAVQVPARDLVEVARLLVQKHQNQFFGQAQRLSRHTFH